MIFALTIDHQALAAKGDKGQQKKGVKNDSQGTEVPEQFRDRNQDQATQDRAHQGGAAPDNRCGDGQYRKIQGKLGDSGPHVNVHQAGASQTTQGGGDKNSDGFKPGNIHSRGPDSLVIVLDAAENKPDIGVYQAPDEKKKNQGHADDEILLRPAVAETINAHDAIGSSEKVKGLDDPGGEKGVHKADNGKIDTPQRQAGKEKQGTDTGPYQGGQRHGHKRRQTEGRV